MIDDSYAFEYPEHAAMRLQDVRAQEALAQEAQTHGGRWADVERENPLDLLPYRWRDHVRQHGLYTGSVSADLAAMGVV